MPETEQILKKMIDACALRQRVIADNIANADTAGFRRNSVEFRATLDKAISSGKPRDLAKAQPKIVADFDSPTKTNGNNVSLQKELSVMAENKLLYDFSVQAISRKFRTMRMAIKGR